MSIKKDQTDEASPATVTEMETAILLLAPTGRDALLSTEILLSAGLQCTICAHASELITLLRQGAGTAVVVAESLNPDAAATLEKLLADQPAWSDPPLILLAGTTSLPKHLNTLLDRVSTSVLHRPLKVSTFTSTVRVAQENRLRQYEGRVLLHTLENRAFQLQKLSLQLVETEERERQRLAQFLHEDLQQAIAGAKLHVTMLPNRPRQQLEASVTAISAMLNDILEKSRNLSHELSPPVLQQHGLPASLQWLVQRMERLHTLEVDAELDLAADPEDERVSTFLFRSVQEMLFNVVKHAGVKKAKLQLTLEGRSVTVRVIDLGRGIEPGALSGPAMGLGLVNIRERAKLLGGQVEVACTGDSGTTITLEVPLVLAVPQALVPQQRSETSPVHAAEASNGPSNGQSTRLRIVLVDDHSMLRCGLRSLLEFEKDMEVIGEAVNGLEAIDLADRLLPDLMLIDVSMPKMDGIEATHCIKSRHPSICIIGLSMFDDEQTAEKMIKAGAYAYLSKVGESSKLLAVIRESCRVNAR